MGRGCALEAKQRWPFIAGTIGRHIKAHGNTVACLDQFPMKWRTNADGSQEVVESCVIYTFPVKHNWWERADLALIKRSAEELAACVNDGFEKEPIVVMPRPGCGNGNLQWCWHKDLNEGEECTGVKHTLAPILDDRFHVITFK